MKFTVPELQKKQYSDTSFKAILDVSAFIERDDEILAVAPVNLQGSYTIEAARYYHFDLHIETILTLACAITLEPVEVPIVVKVRETFSERPGDEDCRIIEGITVDLLPIVWSNIYLEKPLRVTQPNATFNRIQEVEKNEDLINPAFAALKKFKE